MFDNLKKIAELKRMQGEFKKETVTAEKRGVKITMNGNFEVQEILLNPELSLQDQQGAVKDALNEAKDSIQKALARKMMGGGLF